MSLGGCLCLRHISFCVLSKELSAELQTSLPDFLSVAAYVFTEIYTRARARALYIIICFKKKGFKRIHRLPLKKNNLKKKKKKNERQKARAGEEGIKPSQKTGGDISQNPALLSSHKIKYSHRLLYEN